MLGQLLSQVSQEVQLHILDVSGIAFGLTCANVLLLICAPFHLLCHPSKETPDSTPWRSGSKLSLPSCVQATKSHLQAGLVKHTHTHTHTHIHTQDCIHCASAGKAGAVRRVGKNGAITIVTTTNATTTPGLTPAEHDAAARRQVLKRKA